MIHLPTVSIITVCYNAEITIEQTIKSVLSQNYSNLEYIIIDGGSTDGTVEIIKKYSDRINYWVSEPDQGIYDAMNKGIEIAKGDWIHFRNSGDFFYNDDVLARIFENRISEDKVLLYGNCIFKTKKGFTLFTPPILKTSYKQVMPVYHPSSFVRSMYHKTHLFDTKYRSSSDYKFMYNLFEEGCDTLYIPEIIAIYDAIDGFSKDNWILALNEIWDWKHEKNKINSIKKGLYIFSMRIRKWIATLRGRI